MIYRLCGRMGAGGENVPGRGIFRWRNQRGRDRLEFKEEDWCVFNL